MYFEIRQADLGEKLSSARGGGGEDHPFGAEFVQDGEFEGERGAEWWRWL